MPAAQPVYHTYADVATFRDYLGGSGYAANWTQDAATLRRVLESAARTMEQRVGGRTWGPRTETRSYDIGRGGLRNDSTQHAWAPAETPIPPDYWPGRLTGLGIVPLDDWLVAATTVTAYSDTARSSSQTLTAGTSGDYLLEPYNASPKTLLKLNENTSKVLTAGQQTLAIAGTWGWQSVTVALAGTVSGSLSGGATTLPLNSATGAAVGHTLLIDSEQMYVTAINGNNLSVVRGVNGTTAAAHSNGAAVAYFDYPSDVVQCCLEIARNRWKEREAGTGERIGTAEMTLTRPGAEERAILKRLDYYLGQREQGGVYF